MPATENLHNNELMHCNMIGQEGQLSLPAFSWSPSTKRKTASQKSRRTSIMFLYRSSATAVASLGFLRRTSRPKAQMPVPKSGRAAGIGVTKRLEENMKRKRLNAGRTNSVARD